MVVERSNLSNHDSARENEGQLLYSIHVPRHASAAADGSTSGVWLTSWKVTARGSARRCTCT